MYQQPQHQQQSNNVVKVDDKTHIYNPNGFIKFIMWAHTVFYAILGVLLVICGSFICGAIWFAAGLMMCPKVNVTMKFWPRFGLMILLLVIGCILL